MLQCMRKVFDGYVDMHTQRRMSDHGKSMKLVFLTTIQTVRCNNSGMLQAKI